MKNEKVNFNILRYVLIVVLSIGLLLCWVQHFKNSATDAKSAQVNNSAVAKKRKIIKTNLTNYLNSVTDDGTVSVSFYSLGAKTGSTAANSESAALYQKGSLQVESNAHTAQTAASTYKLFITAYLMKQKMQGNFTWSSSNADGFYRMIVNSENDFAETQLASYGKTAINSFISGQGWYSPVFQDGIAAQTTSYSLQLLLAQLDAGTGPFKNSSDRAKILKLMGKQVYRTGIPTGVNEADAGTTVTDKVGFLNDTNNDAGIVTLPNGQKYILVIMTHGHNQSGFSGFPKIAKIAKTVQTIVYGQNAGEKVQSYN
ncbi:serine hydrolase [Paucilactobacillus kaifaensis]|uniref:serine hydrolase n=1 Tax=Paucilactobacillus kaifaensis TaxID=2559921 RepID=UPI0010F6504D|nr:serine hydrolase [Paucilactobacillus kaifaensis]